MKKKIKILITGSKGFVGYNLLKFIKNKNIKNYDFLSPSKSELNLKNFKKVNKFFPEKVWSCDLYIQALYFCKN